ncbi:BrnA antitoxin family protein [Nitrospirillum sp. BR 11163]|uniref:BrnA antitoxin family protein n=1 Tax=Nitrospirillum sp. BR 11163 TaxID=3104323 RepID=UPI002AFDE553|nr:BrnA antitoxin family protein [Nitrospirillum sp. BR 11163]MEA1676351.1 BrnA antitoxin family protein [Nitrospirillum sp. BR 11163]
MKKGNAEPLDPKLRAELEALSSDDSPVDTSDIPEVTDWSAAKRGMFYRPVKTALSLRLDTDVVDWFRRQGDGYQTRINAALREYIETHGGS